MHAHFTMIAIDMRSLSNQRSQMAHKSWTLAVVLSFLSIVPQSISNPIQYPGTSGYTVLGGGSSTSSTPAEVDPEDFSAIKNVATIGDSYAAGIGAGSRRDFSCSRYDHSYPYLLASYEGLENATFQFLACSGALSTDVLAKQVPKINGIVDVVHTQERLLPRSSLIIL